MALVTTFGYLLGDFIQTVLVSLGLATLISPHPLMLDGLRLAGAAYLVYLGLKTIMSRNEQGLTQRGNTPQIHWSVVLRQSVISSIINPKTALFFIAFLPQFVISEMGHPALQILMLGVILH